MAPRAGREGRADKAQERTCVVTREARAPEDLIRFVVGPGDILVPDLRRKLPGRGVWVGLSAAAVGLAVKRKAFERSLKQKVVVSATLADEIDALMVKDAIQALAMANKAGLVSTGFGKVETLAGSGQVAAIIAASDGAEDGKRKIGQALHRAATARAEAGLKPRNIPVVAIFAAAELELALGREHVIHAALVPGPATEGFLSRWRRLVRFRTNDAGGAPSIDPAESDAADQTKTEPAGPKAE
ncbi:RNA-binding protein [Bosea sp. WAO]|uniref:RNA-binding protein n=1 Tax=Bosea sp. WAO TaxID=406341 RepID=UPI0009FA6D76|nr:RNA-binding protein [Bosea sp. WAO]